VSGLRSCLYEGTVTHRRARPVSHAFRYSMFQVMLDLDELDTVFGRRLFWSTRAPSLAWFRRDDHLGDPAKPLKAEVADLVRFATGIRADGPIRLLTHLRYFGYVMNPVSFYYCYAPDGLELRAIVAEVHNTPWGERHCYVLEPGNDSAVRHCFSFAKQFHVSPFMAMKQRYRWSFSQPDGKLTVHMASSEDGEKLFDAGMALTRRPITGWNLARALMLFPFMTLKVVAAIYWQALKLYWKGCPFHEHPNHSSAREPHSA